MTRSNEEGLPSIGSPATRALVAAGITMLEQVGQHRAADLVALHCLGPKAIALLRSALADRGETFRDDTPRPRLANDVREYIDELDLAHRRLFERLHDLILDVVPDAEVVISYQILRFDDELPDDDIKDVIRRATIA
jgi:hypothetical protein